MYATTGSAAVANSPSALKSTTMSMGVALDDVDNLSVTSESQFDYEFYAARSSLLYTSSRHGTPSVPQSHRHSTTPSAHHRHRTPSASVSALHSASNLGHSVPHAVALHDERDEVLSLFDFEDSVLVDNEQSIKRSVPAPAPSASNYYEFDSMHLGDAPLLPPSDDDTDDEHHAVHPDDRYFEEVELEEEVSQLCDRSQMHDDVCSEEESQVQITFEPIDDTLSPLNSVHLTNLPLSAPPSPVASPSPSVSSATTTTTTTSMATSIATIPNHVVSHSERERSANGTGNGKDNGNGTTNRNTLKLIGSAAATAKATNLDDTNRAETDRKTDGAPSSNERSSSQNGPEFQFQAKSKMTKTTKMHQITPLLDGLQNHRKLTANSMHSALHKPNGVHTANIRPVPPPKSATAHSHSHSTPPRISRPLHPPNGAMAPPLHSIHSLSPSHPLHHHQHRHHQHRPS